MRGGAKQAKGGSDWAFGEEEWSGPASVLEEGGKEWCGRATEQAETRKGEGERAGPVLGVGLKMKKGKFSK